MRGERWVGEAGWGGSEGWALSALRERAANADLKKAALKSK